MIKLSKSLYALLVGLIFTMVFFGSAIYYAYVTEEGILNDFDTVEETHKVLNDLEKVNHLLGNLEIESKSYELTSKKEFLDSFEHDVNLILKTIKRIHTELEYDSEQAAKCLLLQDLVQTKLSIVKDDFIPNTHNSSSHELLKDRLHLEINTKLKMVQILDELTKLQEVNLQEEQETVLDKLKRTHFVIGIIGIFSLALTIFRVAFFYQYNKVHQKTKNDLLELNENKNKFFSIISHDLRGPVKNIALMAQLINDQANSSSKSYDPQKILKLIESSAQNLSSLLDNLLKWSKLQMNKIEFQPEKLDLQKVVDDVITNSNVHAVQKNITITDFVRPSQIVYVDQNMISTVLRNLISNSLKFTNKGGKIEIYSSKVGEFTEISVKDNGIGMPMKIAQKIFSIDFKHTTKGTNKEEGTGLGLKLCKEFVEKNGGKIRIESQEGVGSTFIFTIPIAKFNT